MMSNDQSQHCTGDEVSQISKENITEELNELVDLTALLKLGDSSEHSNDLQHHQQVAFDEGSLAASFSPVDKSDNKDNQVTMKMVVNFTEHFKANFKAQMKRITNETGCLINFSNGAEDVGQENNNNVSITGQIRAVERARARIRSIMPLVFSFEFSVPENFKNLKVLRSPYVEMVQKYYNIKVTFRTQAGRSVVLGEVEGNEWQTKQLMEATEDIIHHICKYICSSTQISMEISPEHQGIIVGEGLDNLRKLTPETHSKTISSAVEDGSISNPKESKVIILGQISNVYKTRQRLIGSLPLVLTFDFPEDKISLAKKNIPNLMSFFHVNINIKRVSLGGTISVIIESVERNASNIYEVRRQLLGMEEPKLFADIPTAYHISNNIQAPNNTDYNDIEHLQETFNNISIKTQSLNSLGLYSPSQTPFVPSRISSIMTPHPPGFNSPNICRLLRTEDIVYHRLLEESLGLGVDDIQLSGLC